MKTRILSMVLVLALLATLRGAAQAFDQAARLNTGQNPSTVYTFPLPPHEATELATESQAAAPTGPQRSQAGQPIIIDHNSTDLSKVPEYWINQAKALLKASYGHTSHGSQLIDGMGAFRNSLYDFNTNGVITNNVLSIADTTPGGDLGAPDRTTWASLTRTYLNGSGSNRNTVVWSWCGQADTTADNINLYLNLMDGLETDFPAVNFVYMTGHLVGGSNANINARNNQIRDFARANNRVLFDFADIESYDPAGKYYPNESDACSWCTDWCDNHPADCANLPGSCAHSHPFNCLRKGRATWWMMARLAGWSGPEGSTVPDLSPSTKQASGPSAVSGQTITFTIRLVNNTGPLADTVYLTDRAPDDLAYVPGSLKATGGAVDASAAPTLRWSGVLTPTPAVTITYAVTVTYGVGSSSFIIPKAVTNNAVISVGTQSITRTATVIIGARQVYLPIVLK